MGNHEDGGKKIKLQKELKKTTQWATAKDNSHREKTGKETTQGPAITTTRLQKYYKES